MYFVPGFQTPAAMELVGRIAKVLGCEPATVEKAVTGLSVILFKFLRAPISVRNSYISEFSK